MDSPEKFNFKDVELSRPEHLCTKKYILFGAEVEKEKAIQEEKNLIDLEIEELIKSRKLVKDKRDELFESYLEAETEKILYYKIDAITARSLLGKI